MGKEFIGKRVRLQIGGEPTKDDKNKVIGQDTNVYVSANDLKNYDSIIGEKVELVIGGDVDKVVNDIMTTIKQSEEEKKAEIISICQKIITEKNANAKAKLVGTLIDTGSKIATIGSFILQLKSMV